MSRKEKSTPDILEIIKKDIDLYVENADKKPEELRISLATWREIRDLDISRLKEAITYWPGGVKAACIYEVVVITELGYVIKGSKDDIDWYK